MSNFTKHFESLWVHYMYIIQYIIWCYGKSWVKNLLKSVKLQNLVTKCCKIQKIQPYEVCIFSVCLYCVRKLLPFLSRKWQVCFQATRNTNKLKICKLCKAIFSAFYNISQPNFAIFIIFFLTVVFYSLLLLRLKFSLTCKLSIISYGIEKS